MASVATKLTVDEFLALPEKEGVKRELINGEIWEQEIHFMGGARRGHERVKARLMMCLSHYAWPTGALEVTSESGYKFGGDDIAIPDVSVLNAYTADFSTTAISSETPLICMEVVSSDSVPRLREKLNLYLSHGVAEVWILYPDTQEISIHRANHNVRELGAENTLESDLLPGFSVAVSILFQ